MKETWLATDEDGSKHIFGSRPKLNRNIFGEGYWYAPQSVDVNAIRDFLPAQSFKDQPVTVEIIVRKIK